MAAAIPAIPPATPLRLLEKTQVILKKLKLFGFKTQRTGSGSLHPTTIKVAKTKACVKGIFETSPWFGKVPLLHIKHKQDVQIAQQILAFQQE